MTDTPTPPGSGAEKPLPMKAIGAGVGAVLIVAVAAVALLRPETPKPVDPVTTLEPATSGMTTTSKTYATKEPMEIASVGEPSVWLDVAQPKALTSVLTQNAWLKQTATEPLGRGFLGGWAGLLGSDGKDIGLQKLTQGVVADLIADAVLVQPLRVVWFSGWGGAAPAVIVPKPEPTLTTTFQAIKGAVERGGHVVDGCPGDPPPPPAPAVVEGAPPAPPPENPYALHISRLVVADQAVFAALHKERLVFAKDVHSVINALCAKAEQLPPIEAVSGADVTLAMAPEKFGREAHALFGLVGLNGSPRLALRVNGTSLVPAGLTGALANPGRLEASAIPKESWRLVPEDAPVTLAVNLSLPAELSAASLASFYEGKATGATRARHALVVWQPHGDAKAPTDVAVVWSDAQDLAALRTMFSGPNKLESRVVCDRVVLASTSALMARIEAACAQTSPSLVFAAPAVVTGLTEPMSVGLTVDVGRFLGGLMDDGWASMAPPAKGKPSTRPPEIEAAHKRLRELPRMGFVGTKNGGALAPRGFSS